LWPLDLLAMSSNDASRGTTGDIDLKRDSHMNRHTLPRIRRM
jgi:hypothetical protein